jgi:hypothetical protein
MAVGAGTTVAREAMQVSIAEGERAAHYRNARFTAAIRSIDDLSRANRRPGQHGSYHRAHRQYQQRKSLPLHGFFSLGWSRDLRSFAPESLRRLAENG